ncbi:L-serine ammonia-lyase, iron-sulfur-dependent, subunit alpha [Shigella flexneri]
MLLHSSAIYIHNQLPRLSARRAAIHRSNGGRCRDGMAGGWRYETISMAISSMIGHVSGMICDGASNKAPR